MIKTLTLKNFQSHKDTTIEFSSGINVIEGPTNSGKSSIIRALRKVLRNEPLGDFFIRWGEDTTEIQIDSVIRKVSRGSNSAVNTIEIVTSDGDKQIFKNGRGLPPEEVLNVLDISPPVVIDGREEDFNIIKQKAPSFLIDSSAYPPSFVAKVFDFLSGVGIINLCIFEIKNRINSLNSRNKHLLEQRKADEGAIEKLQYVHTLQKLMTFSERLQTQYTFRNKLREIKDVLNNITTQKRNAEKIVKKCVSVTTLQRRLKKLYILLTIKDIDTRMPETLTFSVAPFQNRLQKYQAILSYMYYENAIKKQQITEVPEKVLSFLMRCTTLNTVASLNNQIEQYESTLKIKSEEHEMLLQDLGVCPTCGEPI